MNIKEKLKGLNVKKTIKLVTLIFGLSLIIFISFFDMIFDFVNFDWKTWSANTSILVGIMIFGIMMGVSIGEDFQKEKIEYDDKGNLVGGLYQVNCVKYNEALLAVENIKIYFSQFWLWYKAKKLKEKKIEYLVDNQFDIRVATMIINNIEKEDLVVGKLIFDENDPNCKIYVKVVKDKEIKFKKLEQEKAYIVLQTFDFILDTYGDSYYLSLYDEGIMKVNEAEKGRAIANKIKRDKRNNFLIKISSSLVISIVWSALTIEEFVSEGGEGAVKRAWLNLLSRITALITSFVSGYATSIVNVKDQSIAVENKVNILKEFRVSYDNEMFVPETYDQMIERELKEQEEWEKQHKQKEVVAIVKKKNVKSNHNSRKK